MRKATRRAFRPLIETVEDRIAASSGLGKPIHVGATAHHKAPPPKHHAPPRPAHHSKASAGPPVTITNVTVAPITITNVTVTAPTAPSHRPTVSQLPTGASNEAWVKLVNMTGQDLQYQISLSPFANGRFLPFDIAANGPDSVQERFSSLIVNGHREEPSFAIRFGNGPVIPLNTGISAQAAQGYYIFLDSNLNYYVAPFTGGTRA
jgi:hypothetical protein